jgi:hypothetical protein
MDEQICAKSNNKRPRGEDCEDDALDISRKSKIDVTPVDSQGTWAEGRLKGEWKAWKNQTEVIMDQVSLNLDMLDEREKEVCQRERNIALREKMLEEKERMIRDEEAKIRMERDELERRTHILHGIEAQSKEERAEALHLLWLSKQH